MKLLKSEKVLDLLQQKRYDALRVLSAIGMLDNGDDQIDLYAVMRLTGAATPEEVCEMLRQVDLTVHVENDGYAVVDGLETYLMDDIKTAERNRKRAYRHALCVSGTVSGTMSGTMSGTVSGTNPKAQKTQTNRAFSNVRDNVRDKNAGNYIYNNNKNKSDIISLTDDQQQAFDLIWAAWIIGRQGKRDAAIAAFAESGLTVSEVKAKVLPAIEELKKSDAWRAGYIQSIATFLKDKLYMGATAADPEVPVLLPAKEALEKSSRDAAAFRKAHPELFPEGGFNV